MSKDRRIVYIKQTTPFHLLPDAVKSEITNSIGSKYSRGSTGSLLMGLNETERRYILPSLISVVPKSEHWETAVKKFYSNLTIHVPYDTGLKLDITTEKREINIDGELKTVDIPLVPLDYVKYKQCLVDKTVGKNLESADVGIYSFYIEDKQIEDRKRSLQRSAINVISQEYLDLIRKNEEGLFKSKNKLKAVFRVLGINPDAYDDYELEAKLEEYRDISIKEVKSGVNLEKTTLIKISRDKNLKDKAFIMALVDKGILSVISGKYVDSDNYELIIGNNLDETVVFLNNQNNLQTVQKYKLRLESEKVN